MSGEPRPVLNFVRSRRAVEAGYAGIRWWSFSVLLENIGFDTADVVLTEEVLPIRYVGVV